VIREECINDENILVYIHNVSINLLVELGRIRLNVIYSLDFKI
jgi:hypothetical protein